MMHSSLHTCHHAGLLGKARQVTLEVSLEPITAPPPLSWAFTQMSPVHKLTLALFGGEETGTESILRSPAGKCQN